MSMYAPTSQFEEEAQMFKCWKESHLAQHEQLQLSERKHFGWIVWQAAVVGGIASVSDFQAEDDKHLILESALEQMRFEKYLDYFDKTMPERGKLMTLEQVAVNFWHIGFGTGIGRVISKMKIPAGWQLVPINLTSGMYNAAFKAHDELKFKVKVKGIGWDVDDYYQIYAAMLKLSPQFQY